MTPAELSQQIDDFREHRESLKRPMSAIAIKRLEARAQRMNAKGVDMLEAFDKAILAGWQSIYEPKTDGIAKPQSHKEAILPNWQAGDKQLAHTNIAQLRRIVK